MIYRVIGTEITFKSAKSNITHVVIKHDSQAIMAKCSSLELAEKAKVKDERLYPHLQGNLGIIGVIVE